VSNNSATAQTDINAIKAAVEKGGKPYSTTEAIKYLIDAMNKLQAQVNDLQAQINALTP
jgi:uncharacterized protein YlxW (UPF0749 family)